MTDPPESTSEPSSSDEPSSEEDPPPIQRGVRRVARARSDADHKNVIELAPPFRFSC